MEKQRIEYVDIAKGLGILLVVWGHSSKILFNEIYAFHMPLFFFIAGFFFNSTIPFKTFINKKVQSLIIPYFIFYTFTLIFYTALLGITGRIDKLDLELILDYVPVDNEISNTPLWFFYALFWMSLLYYILRKYVKNDVFILGVTLFLYGLNEFLKGNNIFLPMFTNRSIGELLYMHLGYICYNRFQLNQSLHLTRFRKIIRIIICITIFFGLYSLKVEVNLYPYILSPIIAIAGLMIIIYFSQLYNKNCRILTYLGKHSLCIFALHLPLFELSRPIAKSIFLKDTIEYEIIIFTTSIVLAIIIGELLMIIFPKYLGKGILTTFAHKGNKQ